MGTDIVFGIYIEFHHRNVKEFLKSTQTTKMMLVIGKKNNPLPYLFFFKVGGGGKLCSKSKTRDWTKYFPLTYRIFVCYNY